VNENVSASPRYAWYVVAVLMIANVSFWIDRQILSLLVVPIRRDLGLSMMDIGYLGAALAVFSTVLAVPIARIADSHSRRNLIAAGIAVWSVMTALGGVANTFRRLLLARVGVGAGEATLQPAATSLLADYFPRERLGSAMGVYSMGIFIGSGIGYVAGGWIVGFASSQATWSWPLVGTIKPWQTVFILVGLPGLLFALLTFTIREPERRDHSRGTVPLSQLIAYVRRNLRTFLCLSFGYALSATVNLGIAQWLATFLIQFHGWSAARAAGIQGGLTTTVGALGVVAGGRLADALVRRGQTDGPLRVGIIGAVGMLVSATAYPFAGSDTSAVLWLVLVNIFAAFPWGAASAAAAEMMPPAIRAQGTALYFFVLNLFSVALGPISVAAVARYVFHSDASLPYALAIVNIVGMSGAILLFVIGMPAYRRTLATRDAA
jgi:MFS family permease